MKEKVVQAFDQLAAVYEQTVDLSSGHNAFYERPAMMKLLPEDLSGKTVLDAGCAAGWYTARFAERGAQVTAIDLSPEMVAACKRRVGDQANVSVCDLSEPLPFEDESFDFIVSSLTLHYLKDWGPTFREFRRVLKPGGTLQFSIHHPFMDYQHFERPDYFAHELLTDVWKKKETGPIEVTFYRRPMMDIVNATAEHFTLDQMIEPQPSKDFINLPEAADWYGRWYERLMTYPWFLIVRARK
ncbi:Methyltransferase domain-containing protein [Paenibacillus catalpae]|uniref:Methyltransferase domain-containing protein n=1 Tax=Paenibacillus catalpae TaxID=1045775 RepID=A0A1I1VET8_9BACL|nr:class I SAM-dependent methyltransferase [Paenibacillus catalpae]SFD81572.1 Methyltransferase domain-containing protein [Paenibacillus catalpae]